MLHLTKWLKKMAHMNDIPYIRMDSSDDDSTPTNSARSSPCSWTRSSSEETVRQPLRIFCEDLDFITDLLVCSACAATLSAPLRFCAAGHGYCQPCGAWLSLCVTCFQPLARHNNHKMDEIANWARYFCGNMVRGCDVRVSIGLLSEHITHCQFRIMGCPVSKHIERCYWRGMMLNLPQHVQQAHKRQLVRSRTFSAGKTTHESKVVYHAGEIFVFHKLLCEKNWMCLLQQVGLTSRMFLCVYVLTGSNGVDRIEMTIPVEMVSSSLSLCYLTAKCFRLSDYMLRHFTDDEEMNLKVYIKDVSHNKIP